MRRAGRSARPDPTVRSGPRGRDGGGGTLSVIGEENREEVADPGALPWRHVCRLSISWPDGREANGTGWLCAPNLIVTAGHCVYSSRRGVGWAERLRIAFPMGPELDMTAPDLRTARAWAQEGREDYDYGAVVLSGPLESAVNPIEFRTLREEDLAEVVVVPGYPVDLGAALWKAEGTVDTHPRTPRLLRHTVDTEIGESGAPLLRAEPDAYRAIGIHVQGETGVANLAIAFVPGVVATLEQWAAGGGG